MDLNLNFLQVQITLDAGAPLNQHTHRQGVILTSVFHSKAIGVKTLQLFTIQSVFLVSESYE
jgi:hypothetical protein